MGCSRLANYQGLLLIASIVLYLWIFLAHFFVPAIFNEETMMGFLPSVLPQSSTSMSLHKEPFIKSSREYDHVVFIGDSTLRYAFLEWIDQEHYFRESDVFAAPEMINEKMHSSWTAFFHYTTEHFCSRNQSSMTCDCQRAEEWNLGTEVENRYYKSPHGNFFATYLQGYGDNQAHGRWHASDVEKAQITDPSNSSRPHFVWTAKGSEWDKLILHEVRNFMPKPTAIVMNAGLWPNAKIAKSMESIIKSALIVTGGSGVIWRGIVPNQKQSNTTGPVPSQSDKAALGLASKLSGFIYQAFPLDLNLSPDDYFDKNHFGNPAIYRQWNADLTKAIEEKM